MKSKFLSIFILIQLFACKNEKKMTFYDFVEVEKIEKVIMSNNSGKFVLSPKQLTKFKSQISLMIYEPKITLKLGAIHMTLIIEGKEYDMTTATHGNFIEINYDMVSKNKSKLENRFFRSNGINFDNYKKSTY